MKIPGEDGRWGKRGGTCDRPRAQRPASRRHGLPQIPGTESQKEERPAGQEAGSGRKAGAQDLREDMLNAAGPGQRGDAARAASPAGVGRRVDDRRHRRAGRCPRLRAQCRAVKRQRDSFYPTQHGPAFHLEVPL